MRKIRVYNKKFNYMHYLNGYEPYYAIKFERTKDGIDILVVVHDGAGGEEYLKVGEEAFIMDSIGLFDDTEWEEISDKADVNWSSHSSPLIGEEKDWKGFEIFEGDILIIIDKEGKKLKKKIIVNFNEELSGYFFEFDGYYKTLGNIRAIGYKFKVIGNMFCQELRKILDDS